MVKKYITYTKKFKTRKVSVEPDFEIKKLWSNIVFNKTEHSGQSNDLRQLAVVEYEGLSDDAFGRFLNNFSAYCFYEVTPVKALALCNEWNGEESFELDEDEFTIKIKQD